MTRAELRLEYLKEVEAAHIETWQELQSGCNEGSVPKQSVRDAWLIYRKARLDVMLCEMDVEDEKELKRSDL